MGAACGASTYRQKPGLPGFFHHPIRYPFRIFLNPP
jgi:hypothetical protein